MNKKLAGFQVGDAVVHRISREIWIVRYIDSKTGKLEIGNGQTVNHFIPEEVSKVDLKVMERWESQWRWWKR